MADNRKYHLDWIRVIVVLLIVPHHVALTYSHIGKGYIYTKEPVNSLYYFIQSDFLNLWFMIILFFVSGVSAYYSISKRDISGFIKERVKKLLIPVLFYLIILGPITAYFSLLKTGNLHLTFIQFYCSYASNASKYLGWAQMWFCAYLFTYSIITTPLLKYLINNRRVTDNINSFLIKKYNLFIPMLIIIFVELLLRPYYPGYQNLVNDWANFLVYLSFFLLGFVMSKSINIFNKIRHLFKWFLLLSLLSTVFYIFIHYGNYNLWGYKVYILSALKGVAEYSWVMVILTVSKKYLNKKSNLLIGLSRSSFGLYIFHYGILTIYNIYLVPLSLNHYLKFIISILLTYFTYYILYKTLITKIKPLRMLCGIV